ncbi:MAG: Arc family DNA-binding protein [Candidatus Hydrogenedentes bacterium]|nr:Arc family DNA-binding protein [Candidatus Hydrogenedentota bacterium]
MPALTIKNLPDELYRSLRDSAKAHRRSLNSEVIVCLEQSLGTVRLDPEAFLDQVRRLRSEIRGPKLTDRFLREAKNAGRP